MFVYSKNILILLILLMSSSYVHGGQKPDLSIGAIHQMLDGIGQSELMYQYNEYRACGKELSGIPASYELQELGRKAQLGVGIPLDRHVPIRYENDRMFTATTRCHEIVFGDNWNPDLVRSVAHHEAVHRKYNDSSCKHLLNSNLNRLAALSSSITALALFQYGEPDSLISNVSLAISSLIAFVTVSAEVSNVKIKHKNHMERRADIEGLYATQCYQCVTAYTETTKIGISEAQAVLAGNFSNKEKAKKKAVLTAIKSYATVEEKESIAADLRRNNKLCAYHSP